MARTVAVAAGTRTDVVAAPKSPGLWAETWMRLRQDKVAMVGLALLVIPIAMVFVAPFSPYDLAAIEPASRLKAPSAEHLLGTDELGRDTLSRILWGSRVSIPVALTAMLISNLVGNAVGIISGYYKGPLDMLIMRFADIMFAFPGLILALALLAVLGPDIRNLVLALSFGAIWGHARLARGMALTVGNELYVESARVIGQRDRWIMFRYILPNSMAPLIISATASLGGLVLAEASLSFLGLGIQPPTPSWGMMLNTGRAYIETSPWVSIFPGAMIFMTVLGFSLLGDGLRDALDPRLRGRI